VISILSVSLYRLKNYVRYNWSSPGLNALGYKEWQLFFEGTATQEEVVERWKLNEHQYAKRQMTWFKKDTRIEWKNASQSGSIDI
jgi:tRNA dimethylallyltransferase